MSKTFHIYGRLYGRYDEETFELTVTEDVLLKVKRLVEEEDDEGIDELYETIGWEVASVLIGGVQEDDLDIDAVLQGEAKPIFLEEYAAGIGSTLRDAKVAFVDAE